MSTYNYAEKLISSGEVSPNVAPLSKRMNIPYLDAAHIIGRLEDANCISRPNFRGKRELLLVRQGKSHE